MSIVKKKIKNAIYIYEVKSFRDKHTKKVKTKWIYIGKLDEDGSIITRKRKLPAKLVKVTKSTQYILKTVRKAKSSPSQIKKPAFMKSLSYSGSPEIEKYSAQNYPEQQNHIRRPFKRVLMPERNE